MPRSARSLAYRSSRLPRRVNARSVGNQAAVWLSNPHRAPLKALATSRLRSPPKNAESAAGVMLDRNPRGWLRARSNQRNKSANILSQASWHLVETAFQGFLKLNTDLSRRRDSAFRRPVFQPCTIRDVDGLQCVVLLAGYGSRQGSGAALSLSSGRECEDRARAVSNLKFSRCKTLCREKQAVRAASAKTYSRKHIGRAKGKLHRNELQTGKLW